MREERPIATSWVGQSCSDYLKTTIFQNHEQFWLKSKVEKCPLILRWSTKKWLKKKIILFEVKSIYFYYYLHLKKNNKKRLLGFSPCWCKGWVCCIEKCSSNCVPRHTKCAARYVWCAVGNYPIWIFHTVQNRMKN